MKKSSWVVLGVMTFALCMSGNAFGEEESLEDSSQENEIEAQEPKDVKVNISDNIRSEADNFALGIRENVSVEKEIEVNSVNFVKLSCKPNEIFIPNPKIADVDMLDDSSLYLMGISPGTTSLVVHDKNGNVIADYTVKVTHPISRIRRAVADIYPDLDLQFTSVDTSLLVKGKAPSPEIASGIIDIVSRFIDSSKIINKLSIETATQVMLKVKIAEVFRNVSKSLGINWRALSIGNGVSGMTYGFAGANLNSGATLPAFGTIEELRKDLSLKEKGIFSNTIGQGEWLVTSNGDAGGLSALISALATESLATVIAEPTLVTISGKKAVFKSGGEQPYTVRQSGGSDNNTTEFKEWGTSLEFTPNVLSEDRISIKVKPVVSTLVAAETKDGTPSLSKKEAETTVELGSGQSLAIAGLLQTTKESTGNETPFLADLPLVGALFRSSLVKRSEREIIIIVTPYVVKPSSKQLKAPTDMVPRMYSPLESIFKRKFHKNLKRSEQSMPGIKYSEGFSIK